MGDRAYLIGAPGSGKSTLMRALTTGLPRAQVTKPFAHIVYFDRTGVVAGVQLGGDDPTFAGTDRLSMNVQPQAVKFVDQFTKQCPSAVIVGEGDRLATRSFLTQFGGTVAWVDTPPDVAAARRAARRSNQNVSWVRGRETKVANLVRDLDVVRLDGTAPLDDLVRAASVIPAFAALTPRAGAEPC